MSTVQNIVDFANAFQQAVQNSATSLPKFTKPAFIESPNFLHDAIAEEAVVNDILKNLYNVYVGYILCALQMDQYVIGNRRVRDVLAPVSTIGAFEHFIDTDKLVEGLSGSLEAVGVKVTRSDKTEYDETGRETGYETTVTTTNETESKYNSDQNKWNAVGGGKYQVDKQHNIPIASGRQIEITLQTGPDSPPINLTLTVQFNTRIIPTPVFEYVLSQDFNRSVADRWLQYRSGEIRFIKDFIFGVDRAERRAKALKTDTSYALQDMLRHQSKALSKHMVKTATGMNSYNLANSIMIIDEEFARYHTKKAGFDLFNVRDRRRFLNTTYSLFIVLVDSRYNRVTIFTNGIDNSASYSFNELKSSAASDKMSIKEVMEYLSKSQMPKF